MIDLLGLGNRGVEEANGNWEEPFKDVIMYQCRSCFRWCAVS